MLLEGEQYLLCHLHIITGTVMNSREENTNNSLAVGHIFYLQFLQSRDGIDKKNDKKNTLQPVSDKIQPLLKPLNIIT